MAVRGFDGPESGERRAGGLWATPPLRAAREAAPVAGARAGAGPASWTRLLPALFYLLIECARPMAWAPALGALRPGLIAAIWLTVVFLARRRWFLSAPIACMLFLVGVMAAQVPFAANNYRAFVGFQEYATLAVLCVFPTAAIVETVGDVRLLLWAYALLHVPTALHGILHGGVGLGGWLGDENDLALALNAAAAISVYLLFGERRLFRRVVLIAVVALCALTSAFTLSRGGFVGLVAIWVFLLVTGPRRGRLLVLGAAVALLLVAVAPANYWSEVRSIRTADENDDTGAKRIYYWKLATRMFADHPFAGVGTRNFGIAAPLYEDQVYADQSGHHMWGRVCHSIYFTVLAEQGLAGVVPFTIVLWWCFRTHRKILRAARRRPDDGNLAAASMLSRAIVAALFAVLACGAFLSAAWYPPLWIMVGLLAGLNRVVFPAPDDQSAASSPA
ncbi:MAG: O-antigen ligase family protein [Candidatus Polarisedimenticolia bacterium]